MTLQEQKNCPMISSKATVASRNSLHWSCKPLIRLRKILASRAPGKQNELRLPIMAVSTLKRAHVFYGRVHFTDLVRRRRGVSEFMHHQTDHSEPSRAETPT